jgi:hypothetical protein
MKRHFSNTLPSYCQDEFSNILKIKEKIILKGTVKVGVPKKVVFTKISAHVSVSNKSIS